MKTAVGHCIWQRSLKSRLSPDLVGFEILEIRQLTFVTSLTRCHYPKMIYDVSIFGLLFVGGLWAGAQNALAGGGSFVTLPILMLTGLDARLANLTSTVALFPGQLVAGFQGRAIATGSIPGGGASSMGALAAINLSGGAIGAGLLSATPQLARRVLDNRLCLSAIGEQRTNSGASRFLFHRIKGHGAYEDRTCHLGACAAVNRPRGTGDCAGALSPAASQHEADV